MSRRQAGISSTKEQAKHLEDDLTDIQDDMAALRKDFALAKEQVEAKKAEARKFIAS